MTEPATLASAATWQPSMSTESATSAPEETTVPGPRMLRSTRAPASTTQPREDDRGTRHLAGQVALARQEDAVAPVHHRRHHDRAALVVQVVEVGLQIGRGGAGVEPVGVIGACEEAAVAHHGRKRLPLYRHPSPFGDPGEHGRLEHVGPRIDFVGRRLVPGRLLDKGRHPPLAVGRHDAERRGIGHRVQGDGSLGTALAVKGDQGRQIEIREHVSVDTTKVSSTPANVAAKRTAPAVSSGSGSTA